MENKVGIKLRHLKINTPDYEQQRPLGIEEPRCNFKLMQKAEPRSASNNRSTSPISRRKIFKNEYVTVNLEEKDEQKFQNNRKSSEVYKFQLAKQISNNSEIQKDCEIERLIVTLKQKSIELEKRDEIIRRLRKQIENLKLQNRQYRKQIASLREQYGNNYNVRNHSLQNRYLHEPYEQLQSVPAEKDNIYEMKINQNYNQKNNNLIENIFSSKASSIQEEVIVSPLMALQNQKKQQGRQNKSMSFAYSNAQRNDNRINQKKNHNDNPHTWGHERINQTNGNKFIQGRREQQVRYTKMKDSIDSKKYVQQTTIPDRFNQFKKNKDFIRERPKDLFEQKFDQNLRPPKKSEASFKQDDYFPFFSDGQDKNPTMKKSGNLSIDDSKQFQFEDFNFQQISHDQNDFF